MGDIPYTQLRDRYRTFIYHGYTVTGDSDRVTVTYSFEIPGLCSFQPTLAFPLAHRPIIQDPTNLKGQAFLYAIGLVELVSYWKVSIAPTILLPGVVLDAEQLEFFRNLYYDGLGEYFYLNGIDLSRDAICTIRMGDDLTETDLRIVTNSRTAHPEAPIMSDGAGGLLNLGAEAVGAIDEAPLDHTRILVPVGGGKDSVVCLHRLLQADGMDVRTFAVNPSPAIIDTNVTAGVPPEKRRIVLRHLDTRLFALNDAGYLNGHTPFSALLAFISAFTAWLEGTGYIALSNESSASESTVHGRNINHQYSKSLDFELRCTRYIKTFLSPTLHYFSFLRPVTELAIARDFATLKPYHSRFLSCNRGSKRNEWCGECPKCLFVWLILSPFVTHDELLGIWGRDLWTNEALTDTLKELLGLTEVKPFECVGTTDEAAEALMLAVNRVLTDRAPDALPVLLNEAMTWIRDGRLDPLHWNGTEVEWEGPLPTPLHSWEAGHQVPDHLVPYIEDMNR